MQVTIDEVKKALEKTLLVVDDNFLLFQALIDYVPIPIFFEDPDGKCTIVNKAFLDLSQLSKEEINKTSWVFCFCRESAFAIIEDWCDTTKNFKIFDQNIDITHPGGPEQYIRVLASPVFHKNRFMGYVGCIK